MLPSPPLDVPTGTPAVPTPAHHAGFPQGFTLYDLARLTIDRIVKEPLDATGRSDNPRSGCHAGRQHQIESDASADLSLWLSFTEPAGLLPSSFASNTLLVRPGRRFNCTSGVSDPLSWLSLVNNGDWVAKTS